MQNEVESVLKAYNLDVRQKEPVGERLYKIESEAGIFALKKSRLTPMTVNRWEQVYRQTHHNGLYVVPPVYLNMNDQLYTKYQDDIYYVQPWLEMTDSVHETKRVMQILAQVHVKTAQKIQMKTEKMKNSFQKYLDFCRSCRERLEAHISVFENERYMSPFELLACTQYYQVDSSLEAIVSLLENLLENMEETMDWQISLNHGSLLPEHIYCSENIYFINWEKACFDSPITDLSAYFCEMTQYYHPDSDKYLDGFTAYTEENELDNIQCQMLLIHLLNPNDYFQLIQEHIDNKGRMPMISQVRKLQHAVRPLLFGLSLKHFIEEQRAANEYTDESSNPF